MKRKMTVLVMLLCAFSVTAVNLFFVSTGKKVNASVSSAARIVEMSKIRGNIYDCNGEKLVNCTGKYAVAANPSEKSADELKGKLLPDEYKKLLQCIGKGTPYIGFTEEKINNSENVICTEIFERYTKNQTACHVVGYINETDNIGVSGIEKIFDKLLKEDESALKLRYCTDACENMMRGEGIEVVDSNYHSPKGVKLTIDKNIQLISENALKLYNINDGACVIMDASNGEIKASASTPVFDPTDISSSLNRTDSPFINRAFTPFSVGSVFKAVVAAAAVKSGNEDFIYNCCGSVKVGNKEFSCSSHNVHGTENLSQAFDNSCNTYFISLALKIGKRKLIDTARNLGFGESTAFYENYSSDAGSLPELSDIRSDGDLANLAFGQGSLLATPVQIAQCYSAFVNKGKMSLAKLIKSTFTTDGGEIFFNNTPDTLPLLPEEADKIKKLLENNFLYDNYSAARPDYDVVCGGKTSTAQSGWYNEKGEEIFHVWFSGFAQIKNTTYVIVIFKENGVSGSENCAPVFREIVNRLSVFHSL